MGCVATCVVAVMVRWRTTMNVLDWAIRLPLLTHALLGALLPPEPGVPFACGHP